MSQNKTSKYNCNTEKMFFLAQMFYKDVTQTISSVVVKKVFVFEGITIILTSW